MVTNKARIYFEDECPRIGSGWRTVEIRFGRKWIHFRDPYTGTKARIRKDNSEFKSLIKSLETHLSAS